jgi:RimJ/RimL family protein N-acetyltransferase
MIHSVKNNININKIKYKYFLFNSNDLINLIKNKNLLIKSFQNIMIEHRNNPNFKIDKLIEEEKKIAPEKVNYFIIFKDSNLVSCVRLIYKNNSKSCYLNMIHTNKYYRNQGICKKTLNKLIILTNKKFNKYELEVEENNIPAIKCYEKVGFVIDKKYKYNNIKVNLMIYNLTK